MALHGGLGTMSVRLACRAEQAITVSEGFTRPRGWSVARGEEEEGENDGCVWLGRPPRERRAGWGETQWKEDKKEETICKKPSRGL